jgi:hypothetical protein
VTIGQHPTFAKVIAKYGLRVPMYGNGQGHQNTGRRECAATDKRQSNWLHRQKASGRTRQ